MWVPVYSIITPHQGKIQCNSVYAWICIHTAPLATHEFISAWFRHPVRQGKRGYCLCSRKKSFVTCVAEELSQGSGRGLCPPPSDCNPVICVIVSLECCKGGNGNLLSSNKRFTDYSKKGLKTNLPFVYCGHSLSVWYSVWWLSRCLASLYSKHENKSLAEYIIFFLFRIRHQL